MIHIFSTLLKTSLISIAFSFTQKNYGSGTRTPTLLWQILFPVGICSVTHFRVPARLRRLETFHMATVFQKPVLRSGNRFVAFIPISLANLYQPFYSCLRSNFGVDYKEFLKRSKVPDSDCGQVHDKCPATPSLYFIRSDDSFENFSEIVLLNWET